MGRSLIITGTALLSLGAIVFFAAFAASGFNFSKFDSSKYKTETYNPDGDFDKIKIDAKDTDVSIKPSEDGKVGVVCLESNKVSFSVSVEGGELNIKANDERKWYDRIGFNLKSTSVTVYLPPRNYETAEINVSTGDVEIEKAEIDRLDLTVSTGEVKLSNVDLNELHSDGSTGDVSMKDVTVRKNCGIERSTGEIFLANFNAARAALKTTTGDVIIERAEIEKLDVTVSTGEVKLSNADLSELHSGGSTGDVLMKDVTVRTNCGIERSTGDISFENFDAGEIVFKTTTGDVRGTLKSEKVFIVKTNIGTVKVPDTLSGGRCEATTTTGDIKIEILKSE